jgi:hypothetical protein
VRSPGTERFALLDLHCCHFSPFLLICINIRYYMQTICITNANYLTNVGMFLFGKLKVRQRKLKVRQNVEPLSAQLIDNALYCLENMSSEHVEVRSVLLRWN